VVGKANAGKSTTIREFLKLADETHGLHVFIINGKRGFTWLTSFEEYGRDVETTIDDCKDYDFLVFACQGLLLEEVHSALRKASFAFKDVHVHHYTEAPQCADEILKFFKSNVTK
jgi:hypothetical protein